MILLDNRTLQRIMRDLDSNDLILCVAAFSEAGREKVLENMSDRLKLLVTESVLKITSQDEEDIMKAACKVDKVISRLEDAGEILPLDLLAELLATE